MNRLRLIIDPQYDFMLGGTLAVDGAMDKMTELSVNMLDWPAEGNNHIVITTDWHPYEHTSFKCNGGEWPTHCLQHSHGAAVLQLILNSAYKNYDADSETTYKVEILEKGTDVWKEEYSIMDNATGSTRINEIMETEDIDVIDVYGIVGTVCVINTIKGLVDAGYRDKIVVHDKYVANFPRSEQQFAYMLGELGVKMEFEK